MSVTILEALQGADHNLKRPSITPIEAMGKRQLHNAVILLEKGYSVYEEVEPLLEKYGRVDAVPRKEQSGEEKER